MVRLPFISFSTMDQSTGNGALTIQRALRYGPVLFWIGLIWLASTEGFSSGNTTRIFRPLLLWLFPSIAEEQIATVHLVTRKAAHFTEYAILAFLARRAFITSSRDVLRERWFSLSLVVVALVAAIDELHQSLVPSRTGSVYDSGIDVAGGLTVLVVFWLYQRAQEKPDPRNTRKDTKRKGS